MKAGAMNRRLLKPSDADELERFLASHADSSMFLRANIRRAGLTYEGQLFQAEYVGAFRDDRLIGVAAHCWNGMMLVQTPEAAGDIVRACVATSGRPVTGFMGPLEQVRRARAALGLEH